MKPLIIRQLITLITTISCITVSHAQNNFTISGSTRWVTSGGVQMVLGAGKVTNNGTISGTGGGSTLIFAGPVIFEGTGVTRVANLVVNHSYGVTQLNTPISVMNTANLVAGSLETNDNLMIRSDMGNAQLIVTAIPSGHIQGLVVKASVIAGACPSFTSQLSVNISGPALTFQWQSSTDSTNWSNVSGATSSTYTPSVTSVPVYYRCQIGATSGSFNQTAQAIKLVFDVPDATISGVTNVAVGSTATLTAATPGGTWSSSNPAVLTVNASTGLITGVATGSALVSYTLTNGSNCTAIGTKPISVGTGAKPSVNITNPAALCAPATVDLTATAVTAGSDPGLTYTYFSDAAGTAAVTTPAAVSTGGTYYIKGTNTSGVASDLMPVIVMINPLPSGSISSAGGLILCGAGASLTLTASGGNTYAWTRNGIAITGVTGNALAITTTGVYTANITTAAGCQAAASNSLTITSLQKPVANFSFDSYCINRPVTFTSTSTVAGSGTVSYQWTDNNGNTSSALSPVFTYNQAATFNMKLKVTPAACPAIADSITIPLVIEVPRTAVRMQPPVNAVINEPITLPARNFGKAYLWAPATGLSDPTSGSPAATLTADQDYRITITAPSGCITVDSVLVRIFDDRMYVPKVFTPNDDGINDKLIINLAGIRQLRYFRVFNRYAQMVFQTTDATVGWDGKFKGAPQPVDTYIWVAEVVDRYGLITIKRGNITLLR